MLDLEQITHGISTGITASNFWFAVALGVGYRIFGRSLIRYIKRSLGWRKPGQRRRAKAAKRVLKRLAGIDHDGAKLAYLRRIDPFVFEELVLEAFERRGLKVQRNERYTGDGGIDGRIWSREGNLNLVQAKRYSKHINAQHMRDFIELVNRSGCYGVFVHTGRTGSLSRQLAQAHKRITIVSGAQLLQLFSGANNQQAHHSKKPHTAVTIDTQDARA
ncbi:hypothetical protein LCGC14_0282380 [marine sediment metagenome]|uniref:Restriction endonuclease type IV Mrr domain-containing protein n=1 Tax=marine sediment metagenome TaxID=412755 RepID=A0A0F9U0H7_9ZZZZ